MSANTSITSASVFVVSGGARGITARCVVRLARQYRCRFLLLGRSAPTTPASAQVSPDADELELKRQVSAHLTSEGEKPTPARVQQLVRAILAEREISATLQAVEEAGGQARYLSVDITDRAAMQEKLPPMLQQMGTVTGIIHGAGNLADKPIEKKTAADFEYVYAAKVQGLENLLATISLDTLRYLVLFTSVAGFYGNVGQSDYAIANEILNKVAHRIKAAYPACRVAAINWGPWDGGMVTPALKKVFDERQISLIPVDDGAEMLVCELDALTTSQTQVVIGNPIETIRSTPGGSLRTYRIGRRLVEQATPTLRDHTFGDHVVLPAVFGISWTVNTCEQLYPGYQFYSYTDYRVFKGIVFDETLVDCYFLDLEELTRTDDELVFRAMVWSENASQKQRFHYGGTITLRRQIPDAPVYTSFDPAEQQPLDGAELYRNGTLFHGPAFQGIERVLNLTRDKLTMRCRSPIIPSEQQGQFPIQTFNPYQTDIQFQCMLVWVRQIYQAGSLPLRAALIEQFRTIPDGEPFYVSMEVQSSNASKLVVNAAAHDEQGRLYVRVEGTEVTISSRLNTMFLRTHSADKVIEQRS